MTYGIRVYSHVRSGSVSGLCLRIDFYAGLLVERSVGPGVVDRDGARGEPDGL